LIESFARQSCTDESPQSWSRNHRTVRRDLVQFLLYRAQRPRNSRGAQIVNAQVAHAEIFSMKVLQILGRLIAVTALLFASQALLAPPALAQRAQYEELVALHARANDVPEALVHRVIVHESKYRTNLIGRGGTIGLMQIKLATARGLGYTGDAAGLRDPATNLAYGIKYLAGAWRAAGSDHARAMHYYASGYYYAAKRQRLERHPAPVLASAPPREAVKPAEASEPHAKETPK
jgi:soluble lytic murein transglycosylase-like protein